MCVCVCVCVWGGVWCVGWCVVLVHGHEKMCVCVCLFAYVCTDCIACLFLLFWKILFMPSFVLFTHAAQKNCVEDSKVSVPPFDIVTLYPQASPPEQIK
jgi:hypothetical protein